MTDIDDLFRTSINAEQQRRPDAMPPPSSQHPTDEETVIDLDLLVSDWNAERDRQRDARDLSEESRGRLELARARMAERIGSHPEAPLPPGPVATEVPDWSDGHTARVEQDPDLFVNQSWRARRRARREIDRLQKQYAKEAPPAPDDDPVAVTRRIEAMPVPVPEPVERGARAQGPVRFPIVTRSIMVWLFIFMMAGLAFGASAAFWWSHFSSEVDSIRAESASATDRVDEAADVIDAERQDALVEIDEALGVFDRIAGAPEAVATAGDYAGSVWMVETLDEDGSASVGSAFVVANVEDQSLLLTSLEVVDAATASPGPAITLRSGEKTLPAELWSWDTEVDLALLLVDDPGLEPLEWASEEDAARALGSGVVVVGGLGGAGASAVPGLVVDQSLAGLQHTAPVGAAYRGGPVLTGSGQVLGVASLAYRPLGFDPGEVRFAATMDQACQTVLVCATAAPPGPGAAGGPAAGEPQDEAQGTAD